MVPDDDPVSLEALLDDCDWLRRLARGLVKDPQRAEDAVQDTLVAALESPPPRPGRNWLASVLRNFVRQEHRSRTRRELREAAVGRSDESPSTRDVAERLELQRRVVEAVTGLDEKYRQVLVLRYFDGLRPREIGSRLELPAKTVYTRLERATAQLRARLDRDYGDRRWLSAMLALGPSSGSLLGGLGAGAGGVLVSTKVQLAALVAVLAVGTWWVGTSLSAEGAAGESVQVPVAVAQPVPPSVPVVRPAQQDAAAATRRVLEGPDATALAVATDAKPTENLLVRVVAARSGAPVPNAWLDLRSSPDPTTFADGGSVGDSGVGNLHVPIGIDLRITARPRSSVQDPEDPVDRGEVAVPALAFGERREVVIELPHGLDGLFYGRVVRADDGRPIAGARILPGWGDERNWGQLANVVSGVDGRFTLPFASWRPSDAEVRREGFGPALVELFADVQSAAEPFLVRLAEAAEIEARVEIARGPAPHEHALRVRAFPNDLTQPAGAGVRRQPLEWRVSLDGDGRATVTGLPAGLPLTVELVRGRELVWREPEPLVLAPGERHEVTWQVGSGSRVYGELRDTNGEPVSDRDLWILAVAETEDPAAVPMMLRDDDGARIIARTSTDASGRYEILGLSPGTWWIGPGATRNVPDRFSRPGAIIFQDDVAPAAISFELAPGPSDLRLDLTAHRGLKIRGRVITPEGVSPRGVMIIAEPQGGQGQVRGASGDDGRFVLGPLTPGRYRLMAFGMPSRLNRARPVWASAGDQDVRIVIADGLSISGRVVDPADGLPRDAHVHLILPGGGSLGMGTSAGGKGAYHFADLDPGVYFLSATSKDGRLGVREVELADVPLHDIELELREAARLRLSFEGGTDKLRCSVVHEGRTIDDFSFLPGDVVLETVPPGPIELRLYGGGEVFAERTVEAQPGKVLDVPFGKVR